MESAIRAELERFDVDVPLLDASTPPSSWYTDAAFFELERRSVLRRGWHIACRRDQLEARGAFVAGQVAGEPYVVVRGSDGELRAFHNVCRHHAAAVTVGEGRCERFVCPYHGWVYDLDGRRVGAPGVTSGRAAEPTALVPIRVACWRQWVWIDLEGDEPELSEAFAPVDAALEALGSAPLRFRERRVYDLACNWKVFVDNYLDGGYHVPVAHRSLAAALSMSSYEVDLFERGSLQTCASDAPTDDRLGGGAVYAFLAPTLMLNRYGRALDLNLVVPVDATHTRVVFDFFFEPGVSDAQIERSLAESDRIQREDVALSEAVQRGLASSAYDVGVYAAPERAMHHFHVGLARALEAALGTTAAAVPTVRTEG